MMDYVQLALGKGALKAAQVSTKQLRFSEEFRAACEQNFCGRYGKSYTCPPHVGEIGELIDSIKQREAAIVWQTVHGLEDSYDFEGMRRGQDRHNKITLEIADHAWAALGDDTLVLGAGGCFLCRNCAVNTQEPCRQPNRAISSLEAYGIDVSAIESVTKLKYINGKNTVTYFSGLFY